LPRRLVPLNYSVKSHNIESQVIEVNKNIFNGKVTVVKSVYNGAPTNKTRMWANAQPDGRPAEHRWRPLFNAAKFG